MGLGDILDTAFRTVTGRPLRADPAVEVQDPRLQSGDFLRGQITTGLSRLDGGRAAPQAGGVQFGAGPQDQLRRRQLGLAQQLTGIAGGRAPGAGELGVQRQANQAIANQAALASGARGPGAGLAAQRAASNATNIGVNAAGQAGIAARNDQTQAQGLLGQLLGQTRGQDIGVAGQQAQLDQGTQLANLDAQLQSRGMDDRQRLALISQLTGIDQIELQTRLAQAQLGAAQRDPGLFGDLLSAGGQVLGTFAGTGGGG